MKLAGEVKLGMGHIGSLHRCNEARALPPRIA
jgi:hypothetical protein